MAGYGSRFHAPEVAVAASSVCLRIAVQNFLPKAPSGDADAISVARNRCQVAHRKESIESRSSLSDETDNGLFPVPTVNPAKPRCFEIQFEQGRFGPVQAIHFPDPALHSPVGRVIESIPVQAVVMIPFPPLTYFSRP